MTYAICIDFGSTYTKVVCADLKTGNVVVTDKFPSTVHEDAEIGLNHCFDRVREVLDEKQFQEALKLATSSAAGGLRMAVIGLTESLSTKAGRNASFSAGAKIVYNGAGLITEAQVEEIETLEAEILLLCGGYEKGNTHGVLQNAEMLSNSRLTIPVIYGGNSLLTKDIRLIFKGKGKECFIAENIIPSVGTLNTESTAKIIRDLFMSRITNMKGVGLVQEKMDGPIVPTPAAVLKAGELLSQGTKGNSGLGKLMMADVGGATTDIYSFAENISYSGAKSVGSPEPFAKRTVEGDLGMRESSVCLVKEVGEKTFADRCGIDASELSAAIDKRLTTTKFIAETEEEKKIDFQIASNAVKIAARRHAGVVEREFSSGAKLVQRGKNLREIKTIVGIGGIIVNGENPDGILENVALTEKEKPVLLPSEVQVLIDKDYVFFAAGLLREYNEEAALKMMLQSLRLI